MINKEGSNSIYSMHTMLIVFNNFCSIIMSMKQLEKEKLEEMR